jgi:conjugal transfer/entry exclusion protein
MNHAPWTDIGYLQTDIQQLKNELQQKANSHEIHSINSRMDSLERTCVELSSQFNEILFRLQKLEESQHP